MSVEEYVEDEYIDEIEEELPVEEEGVHYKYVVPVKFHNTNKSYSFGTDEPIYETGDLVVVETIQGIELGECQAPALSTEIYRSRLPLRPIIRKASSQDRQDYEDNIEQAKEQKKSARKKYMT